MIVDTGLNATLKYMSSPLLIPPCIPPEKLDLVLTFPFLETLNSSLCSEPFIDEP